MRGTTPSSGSVKPWETCSGTLTEWSTCSSRQTRPIPRPKLAKKPSAISNGRLGLIGTVGSTMLESIFTQGLLTICIFRMPNSIIRSSMRTICSDRSSRSWNMARIL